MGWRMAWKLTAREFYRTNMVLILGLMQLSKKVPFDNPDVLFGVRCLYIASNVLIFGLYLYVQSVINKKKGRFSSFQ